MTGSLGSGGGLGGLAIGDIEDVQLSAGGGLSDGVVGWIVRNVVSVNDVVVPVSLTLLQSLALEAEVALPATRLGCVLGKWELAIVVVPRAEQVDGLDVGGGAEGEVKLDMRRHYVLDSVSSGWFLRAKIVTKGPGIAICWKSC